MAAAWRHLVASLNSLFKYVGPTRLVDSIDLGRNAVISRILSKSALSESFGFVPSPFLIMNLLIACFCCILRSRDGCPTGRLLEPLCKTIRC